MSSCLAGEQDGVVLCILEDEADDELDVIEAGGVVRSDVSAPTWM